MRARIEIGRSSGARDPVATRCAPYASGSEIGAGPAISAIDQRTFQFEERSQGKPIYKMTFKVSEDGKTITETGKPVGADEPFTAVYERQTQAQKAE